MKKEQRDSRQNSRRQKRRLAQEQQSEIINKEAVQQQTSSIENNLDRGIRRWMVQEYSEKYNGYLISM